MVWQKCQMKKYFREPMHQEISWRLLLTDKSDLWDTSWERVSWKWSCWPGWSKAKELEVDKGKRWWTGCYSLVGNSGRSMTYWKSLKIVMNILIANVRVWHFTDIGLDTVLRNLLILTGYIYTWSQLFKRFLEFLWLHRLHKSPMLCLGSRHWTVLDCE